MKKLKVIILIVISIITILIVSIICLNKIEDKEQQEAATPEKEIERPFNTKDKITRNEYYFLNKISLHIYNL